MLIQKILHVHHNISETRSRLSRIGDYQRFLEGVEMAVVSDTGMGQFDCALSHGLRAHGVLVELPTPDDNQVLFRSTTGNMNLSGLIEFLPVRPNLTEVQVTVDYGFKSPLLGLLDRFFRSVERFFHRQLAALQTHIEGAFTTAPGGFTAHLPQLAR